MQNHSDPTLLSATQLAAEIAARRITASAAVDAYLARISAHDDALHAYTEVYARDARLAAAAADNAIRAGHAVGPLHGVPIALKDLIEIEGRVVTGGCAEWRERRAERTATLVKRLLAQGMIVLGKTHTVEFAMGGWGTNMHMGTPRNPWDDAVARIPGGSSSGSGVAVAARLAPWAVGTDTGGSVRLPASFCGHTALKVTAGRISTHGVLPLSPTLDTPGPMTRSVEDAALLYRVMRGPDPLDRRTLGVPDCDARAARPQRSKDNRHIRGMQLRCLADGARKPVAADVLAAYDRSLDELANLGADIQPLELPFDFADVAALNGRIMSAESYALLAELVDDPQAQVDENVRSRIRAGREVSARAYLTTLARRDRMRETFTQAMATADALLTPTTLTTAPALAAIDETTAPSHFTRFGNFLELCALALPNGVDAGGLPTSLQIIGRPFAEETLLTIGQAYQQASSWHEGRPPAFA